MLGAILTNKSPVTLDQVTPLARLTGEYTALVVPADSPIQSLEDLIGKFKADPGSVSWGGGSAGGSDQILAGLIAKEVGVEPAKINYVATAGGGELMAQILGGHITVAMGGYNEFAPQIKDGKLRAVALSAPERLPDVDTPTLKEQGVNVEFINWRGVFAARPQGGGKEAARGHGRRGGRRATNGKRRCASAAGSTSTSPPVSSPPS